MGHEAGIHRFLIILILFVVSIILIIFSPNMVRILLGWDGLGLVSYCLVIYYQNMKSLNAGLLTILSNRVGDVAILIRISWLFNWGSWNIFLLEYIYSPSLVLLLSLVMLASLTKSAQIPFSAWLPAAMAAPTPISSLVHSSTLVTAGVYLIIRFREMLGINWVLYYLSVATMIISGFGANFEIDLKKIIALSTLRQLGVMMISLSVGIVELAYFHLLMHALFKSLLFLCAGVFIHGSRDKQDIRSLGCVIELAPLTSFYFLGCSLALCGFPFMSGFYSRDLILETWIMRDLNLIKFILVLLATAFTVTYSVRLLLVLVVRAGRLGLGVVSIETFLSLGPMRVLFVFAVVRGAGMGWLFMPNTMVNLGLASKIIVFGFVVGFRLLAGGFRVRLQVGLGVYFRSLIEGVVGAFSSSLWWLRNLFVK